MEEVLDKETRRETCNSHLGALEDTLYAIGGKWKLKVISTMRDTGTTRFNELLRHIPGISAKVLSNELKELELNGLVMRTVYTETPVVIEYQLTEYSETLHNVLVSMIEWGRQHKARIRAERS